MPDGVSQTALRRGERCVPPPAPVGPNARAAHGGAWHAARAIEEVALERARRLFARERKEIAGERADRLRAGAVASVHVQRKPDDEAADMLSGNE